MTTEQALYQLARVAAQGYKHPHYQRTVDYANDCLAFDSGDEKLMAAKIKRFAARESPTDFAARLEVTINTIKPQVRAIRGEFRKVSRANYKVTLTHTNEQALTDILTVSGKFGGRGVAVDSWIYGAFDDIMGIDPNAFFVVEFGQFDYTRELLQPYPFIVYSKDAVNYGHTNGFLDFLTAKVEGAQMQTANGFYTPLKYTTYTKQGAYILQNVPSVLAAGAQEVKPEMLGGFLVESLQPDGAGQQVSGIYKVGDNYWQATIPPPYNLPEVPAMRVGYLADPITNGETCLAVYDNAIPHFEKQLKCNSELDITMCRLAHALRLRYAPKCDEPGCLKGHLHDGSVCGTCKGTGLKTAPTTAQEEIVLPWPEMGEELRDLGSLVAFVSPDTGIIQQQIAFLNEQEEKAVRAVFKTDVFTRAQIANTATGQNIDLQSVYDTLAPYAAKVSQVWEFIYSTIANLVDKQTGFTARLVFPSDFKLKGLTELLADLEALNRAGASPAARRAVSDDIARLLFRDEPQRAKRYAVQTAFDPFAGYSLAERTVLMSSDLVTRRTKVLAANLGQIFDTLELANPNFNDIPLEKQQALVNSEVDAILTELGTNSPTPSLLN